MNLNEWHGLIKECQGLLKSKDEWAALAESTRKDYKQKAAALNGRLPSQPATCMNRPEFELTPKSWTNLKGVT